VIESKVFKSENTSTCVFIPCVGGTYGDGNREAYCKVGVDVSVDNQREVISVISVLMICKPQKNLFSLSRHNVANQNF
jgi:hypothetical protein